MSTAATVSLWGNPIGAVSLDGSTGIASFQFEPDFVESGIEVSPLVMPLANRVYSFPELSRRSFHGLPGLLADSLPDRFGTALIDAWLEAQGREAGSLNCIERLCYTGGRGMGALEYRPAMGPRVGTVHEIRISAMVELASRILMARNSLDVSFTPDARNRALGDILRIGTSAGGARAKAVIAWNSVTNEVRSGQVAAGDGFEYWILKFDGVQGNRDRELDDPAGYGLIEYAYFTMAVDCGIDMTDCRLLEEGGRQHFMTRRFDRLVNGGKLHMQSLGALAHYDFNLPGAYAYEQVFHVLRRLKLGPEVIEQMFRRMVFNIVGRNQDDHVKNIAFLMDQSGNWSLSPAFDITYAYNPAGEFTSQHQMTLNGKRENFDMADFRQCARNASMKRGRAEAIVREIQAVFSRWHDYADKAGVVPRQRDQIQSTLLVRPFGRS